jgi:lipoyl synthase
MPSRRLPPWIRTRLPAATDLAELLDTTYGQGLATVCREARCPNRGTCSASKTATFLILGDHCTRNCQFCAVRHGTPAAPPQDEPQRVAEAVVTLGLRHVVITSVTRDDLPDGGAGIFAETVEAVRARSESTTVEVLVPDFQGSVDALSKVIAARPEVLGHNVETVPRLYTQVRAGASFDRSLTLLRRVAQHGEGIVSKSGIMLGLGESGEEVFEVLRTLANAGCAVVTIGQYLAPSSRHHPVDRFVSPEEFAELEAVGVGFGIRKVVAGPLVRSSFKAGEILADLKACRGPREG